ncbi:Disease resistance protein RGA2 [Rhynchospora pubera]|uniref:Disease resistance protein RGA2 n=1 Tax=Rhynchospora pubera TaxID=906938 RepID=A0AAV8ECA3_9POAL|nr:Disease resistance protein RGA2 [Rhynchospora pubera]
MDASSQGLKAVAHEAEEALDELKLNSISKAVETETTTRSVKKARYCSSLPDPYLFRLSMLDGKKLKEILEKMEAIVSEMRQFGFFKTSQPMTVINPLGIGHMRSAESESTVVIGRSDDLEKIVATVLGQAQSEAKAVAVLPILGEDGFGKATLTQLIYTDVRIQSHFQVKSWVRIYNKLNIAHVTKLITDLTTMGRVPVLMDAMDLIRQCLQAELTGKRYLLVLINVLNEKTDNWEQLKPVLDCGRPGSMIFVTTRSYKVASIMGTMTEYILKELNDDDLWGIFRQRAFGMGVDERPKLVEID